MYCISGRRPVLISFMPVSRIFVSMAVVAATLVATLANAQAPIPLTLAEAERLAADNEPGRLAIEARSAALGEQARVAGALPEPVLRVGLNNYPIESGGFSTEGMTNAALGLRQEFPAAGTRDARSRRYRELSAAMGEQAEMRARDVLLAARGAWLDLYYWEHANELVQESRPFFAELATITRSLYAVGRRSQQDVVRAELELSRLDDRLIDIERQRTGARAALGEWIGTAAARPVARKLPAWGTMPALPELQAALANHPLNRAAAARVEAETAGVELADGRSKPGWAIELAYSYREGVLAAGTPRSDFVSLNVTVALPYFRKAAVDGRLTAALHEQSAAKASRLQVERHLHSRLVTEYSRWHELTRRLELYDARILGQARAQATASLNAYQSDKGDFADVMRAHIDDLNTRIDHVRLQVERASSYATLANLGGFEL